MRIKYSLLCLRNVGVFTSSEMTTAMHRVSRAISFRSGGAVKRTEREWNVRRRVNQRRCCSQLYCTRFYHETVAMARRLRRWQVKQNIAEKSWHTFFFHCHSRFKKRNSRIQTRSFSVRLLKEYSSIPPLSGVLLIRPIYASRAPLSTGKKRKLVPCCE